MNKSIEDLIAAQKYALSRSPKIGGFPFFAEILRQAGVRINHWFLPSCQSIYVMKDASILQQETPLIIGTYEIPKFD